MIRHARMNSLLCDCDILPYFVMSIYDIQITRYVISIFGRGFTRLRPEVL